MTTLDQLRAALHDPNKSIRRHAAEVLAKLGESALDSLISSLPESDQYTKRRIIEAIGSISSPRAIETLDSLMGNENPYTRKSAAAALGNIRDKTAVKALIGALRQPEMRDSASQALYQLGEIALEPLVEASRDPDPAFRRSVALCLENLGTPKSLASWDEWCAWEGVES